MSKYTITIKALMDNHFDFQLNEYPIFDESYRDTLNQNILNHYYMNEIGFETAPLFRFYLKQKLNEIMPYYNVLYEKQKELLDNIAGNVNLTETLERVTGTDTESSSNSKSNANGNSKNVFLDTPQGGEYKGTIDETPYATNVTFGKSDSESNINDSSKSSGTGTENYIKKIIGNNGNKYSFEVLNKLRTNLFNIDLLIINDLEELFMQIF